ncbi:hypothetical protein ACTI_54390 [Actinoplanes sp. OR16]|uniref:hypothetical protein n=1 Tax=Actinoplanes sp. OR16 TaxID=946334 RepID=UPI000F6B7A0D|nr:hypothetical protein [Actinoplanes sp. OR16]BBH68754.1 hypothetical protein ACTI_54390 [Actinoplanes sp. OR16]
MMRLKLGVAAGVLALAGSGCGGADAAAGSAFEDPVGRGFPIVTPPQSPAGSAEAVATLSPVPPAPQGTPAPQASMAPRESVAAGRPQSGVPARSSARVTAPDQSRGSVTAAISGYAACSAKGAVVLTATFDDSYAYRHVFLDTDGDATTGYQVDVEGGFGAEFMIEDDLLYKSAGAGWSWKQVGGAGPLMSRSGGTYRWQVKPAFAGDTVVFGASTEAGAEVSSPIVPVRAC